VSLPQRLIGHLTVVKATDHLGNVVEECPGHYIDAMFPHYFHALSERAWSLNRAMISFPNWLHHAAHE
jgi:hypothetical protein